MSAPERVSPLELTEAQRRAIGHRLARMTDLLRRLEALGVVSAATEEVHAALGEIAARTGAVAPSPERHPARAFLAPLVVAAGELAPRRLSTYGPLKSPASTYLASASRRLETLAHDLMAEVEQGETRGSR